MDRLPVPDDGEQPSGGTGGADVRQTGVESGGAEKQLCEGECSDRGEEAVEGSVESVRVGGKFGTLTVKLLGCVFLGSFRLQMEGRVVFFPG